MTDRDARAEIDRAATGNHRGTLSRRDILTRGAAAGIGGIGLNTSLVHDGRAAAAMPAPGSARAKVRGSTPELAAQSADAIFPTGFVWGAATSAYQIEGAHDEDGRLPSIWDTFARTPGKTFGGHTGDVATDHYHRYPEDVALMCELGLGAYRFSIAWPRVVPTGAGRPNPAGLDFYKRLVAALREAGIEPYATLYHWDLPQALQDGGGWANRDTAARFGEYAHAVAVALGGKIPNWITINEPWVAAVFGHLTGQYAPGLRDLPTALRAGHHLLLAHAEATAALRAEARPGDQVGITINLSPIHPASDAAADAGGATRRDAFLNRWFLDALFHGAYPNDLATLYAFAARGMVQDGDLERIAAPIDLLGLNYYFRTIVRHEPASPPLQIATVPSPPGRPTTAMNWEVYPEGLHETLTRVQRDYSPPAVYITENGAAYDDRPVAGAVEDVEREAYLHDHLLQAHRAIADGVPLRGYFAWSLLDNFEWAYGYRARFGLVSVDYETQARTIKRSGRWYAGVIAANGVQNGAGATVAELRGPYRGDGTDRPQDIALPPAPMPMFLGGRLLKGWRYVSIWSPDLSLSVGSVNVGPVRQEFWAVWDRQRQRLWERTQLRSGLVHLDPGSVRVDDEDVAIAITLDETTGFQVVVPDGRAYTWTRKQLVRAHGTVHLDDVELPVEATALIDDNAGYHPRRTRWRWSGGAGQAEDGRDVAWSVIVGLNDPPERSERTLWIDGVEQEIGPVRFAPDLSAVAFAEGGELRFEQEAVRARRDNLVLIRSSYRQPFGTFAGTLPGGIALREAHGVMEWHEARW